MPSRVKQTLTAIWVRLPELPTEFYYEKILSKVGNKMERLLKVDACTSTTLRGSYARIYVELPLNKLNPSCGLAHTNNRSYMNVKNFSV